MNETILTIIFAVLTILGAGVSYYFFVKNKILAAANNAINTAEDTDKVEAEKMAVALAEIQKILPIGAKFIFTEERIRTLLQAAFDGIELFAKKQANK